MADYKFPTEVVELPSKGHFYVNGHPLSSGNVEIKYMTAKEEDILSSENLIRQGIVIDKLLEALIVDKSINVNDLLTGDKNAIMVAARVLAYGKEYNFEYGGVEQSVDLTQLSNKKIDLSKHPKGINEFDFKLPNSKREIKFKLPNGHDEAVIDEEVKAMKKVNKNVSTDLTTRFKKTIISVDGKTDVSFINKFVDNEFLSVDSLALRKYIQEIQPDIDMIANVKDVNGEEIEVTIPVTLRFFWPTANL